LPWVIGGGRGAVSAGSASEDGRAPGGAGTPGGAAGFGCDGSRGTPPQEANTSKALPTIAVDAHLPKNVRMLLILLEALLALAVLVLIVWWTMFSGRPKGELPRDDTPEK
jgi:hypothetical protein